MKKTLLAIAGVLAFTLGCLLGLLARILPWLVLFGICMWIASCQGWI